MMTLGMECNSSMQICMKFGIWIYMTCDHSFGSSGSVMISLESFLCRFLDVNDLRRNDSFLKFHIFGEVSEAAAPPSEENLRRDFSLNVGDENRLVLAPVVVVLDELGLLEFSNGMML